MTYEQIGLPSTETQSTLADSPISHMAVSQLSGTLSLAYMEVDIACATPYSSCFMRLSLASLASLFGEKAKRLLTSAIYTAVHFLRRKALTPAAAAIRLHGAYRNKQAREQYVSNPFVKLATLCPGKIRLAA